MRHLALIISFISLFFVFKLFVFGYLDTIQDERDVFSFLCQEIAEGSSCTFILICLFSITIIAYVESSTSKILKKIEEIKKQ